MSRPSDVVSKRSSALSSSRAPSCKRTQANHDRIPITFFHPHVMHAALHVPSMCSITMATADLLQHSQSPTVTETQNTHNNSYTQHVLPDDAP